MFIRNDYPILEFDDNRDAKINPTTWVDKKFECNKMVITFFPEVVDKLIADGKIVLEKTIGGENIVLVYRFVDTDILITLGAVGCPSCAGNLDLFNAMGAEKVMFCGGGGVLDKKIEVGQLLVVDGAIRDEGFSYHYNDSAQKTPAVRKNVRGMNAPITNNATIIPTGFSSGIVGFSWPDVLQNAVIRCIALLFQEKHFR